MDPHAGQLLQNILCFSKKKGRIMPLPGDAYRKVNPPSVFNLRRSSTLGTRKMNARARAQCACGHSMAFAQRKEAARARAPDEASSPVTNC